MPRHYCLVVAVLVGGAVLAELAAGQELPPVGPLPGLDGPSFAPADPLAKRLTDDEIRALMNNPLRLTPEGEKEIQEFTKRFEKHYAELELMKKSGEVLSAVAVAVKGGVAELAWVTAATNPWILAKELVDAEPAARRMLEKGQKLVAKAQTLVASAVEAMRDSKLNQQFHEAYMDWTWPEARTNPVLRQRIIQLKQGIPVRIAGPGGSPMLFHPNGKITRVYPEFSALPTTNNTTEPPTSPLALDAAKDSGPPTGPLDKVRIAFADDMPSLKSLKKEDKAPPPEPKPNPPAAPKPVLPAPVPPSPSPIDVLRELEMLREKNALVVQTQPLPPTLQLGQGYPGTVVVRNTGLRRHTGVLTWTIDGPGTVSPASQAVDLAAGAQVTLRVTFTITAPGFVNWRPNINRTN